MRTYASNRKQERPAGPAGRDCAGAGTLAENLGAGSILQLQRDLGNRAVQRWVASPGHTGSPQTGVVRRQPHPVQIRLNRFSDAEKAQLRRLGRGEINGFLDHIIADQQPHQVQKATIDGVEHTWYVTTELLPVSEREQLQGLKFGGALSPETRTPSANGKQVRHDLTFTLRGGNASSFESALHELIHLRIAIDRVLPADQRSSFFGEYNQLIEMTEVMATAKFGAGGTLGDKSSYGALPLAAGTWERVKVVLNKMEVIRNFFINQDASAQAAFDKEPLLTPAALVEFILQEKYVTQAAARATSRSGSAPNNDTVATRYAGTVTSRFQGFVSPEAQERIAKSPVGSRMLRDATDSMRVSMKALYDELDQLLRQAQEAAKNPPAPPANMPDPMMFQWRPLGLDGQPVQPAPAKLPEP
jgi:hypothetical protein